MCGVVIRQIYRKCPTSPDISTNQAEKYYRSNAEQGVAEAPHSRPIQRGPKFPIPDVSSS